MNGSELLRLLQTEHDETTARVDNLHQEIERLATALAEAKARLAELAATRKVIEGLTPPDYAPTSAETATVYQRIVTVFNERPEKVFRVRDLHEHLGLPTDEPSINVTRSRLDDSFARDSSSNPDAAAIRNGLNALSKPVRDAGTCRSGTK